MFSRSVCSQKVLYSCAPRNVNILSRSFGQSSIVFSQSVNIEEFNEQLADRLNFFGLDNSKFNPADLEKEANELKQYYNKKNIKLSPEKSAALKEIVKFKVAILNAKKQNSSAEEFKKFKDQLQTVETTVLEQPFVAKVLPTCSEAYDTKDHKFVTSPIYSEIITTLDQFEAESRIIEEKWAQVFPTEQTHDILRASNNYVQKTSRRIIESFVLPPTKVLADDSSLPSTIDLSPPWKTDEERMKVLSEEFQIAPGSAEYNYLEEKSAAISSQPSPEEAAIFEKEKILKERRSALQHKISEHDHSKPFLSILQKHADLSSEQIYSLQHNEQEQFTVAVRDFLSGKQKPTDAEKLQFMKEQQNVLRQQRQAFLPEHATTHPVIKDEVLIARFNSVAANVQ